MGKRVLTLSGIALIVALIRFVLKPIFDSVGVPTFVGSMVASITIVLLIGAILIFWRVGKDPRGTYLRAAGWFFLLSAWCQMLIISGILMTEWTHRDTYFSGPWELVKERFPTATSHAIAHTQGFWVLTAMLMIIGAVTYVIARRGRPLVDKT